MSSGETAVVVLAAGQGTRMRSHLPKVMHVVAGRPMIAYVLDAVDALQPDRVVVVVGDGMEGVADAVRPHPTVVQSPRLGTGHAVMAARPALEGFAGDVLVVYGDTPLISAATLERLLAARRAADEPAVAVLGFRPPDPGAYGRLIVGANGGLEAIVEAKDATPDELAVPLCNAGAMAIDGRRLFALLDRVGRGNAKGEYYLTDVVGIARADGISCAAAEGDADELLGVNSRADLARVEAIVQSRLRTGAMAEGATLVDPSTVFLCHDTRLGRDVTIGPFVVFGPGVTVGDEVEIRPFSHLEGATIDAGAVIGPFARLRPGALIASEAHIGNFVEIKNACVEEGAKVNHLTYIGDARVGARANIGAGTITCNYDGFLKSHTDIGAGAFIGSNTCLIAPVKIGDGAIVGAASAISKDVPADALALTRGPHTVHRDWAKRFRERRRAEKAKAPGSKQKV